MSLFHTRDRARKRSIAEALFRKLTFETMQLLALCTCEMILSDDNLSLSVRYRAVFFFTFCCDMEAIILSRLEKL
jgi:hypothetical protein